MADEAEGNRPSAIREPGWVVEGARGRAGVITGDGVLWLEEVQIAGKRALPIEAFLRGAPGFVGSRLA
jgi:methionyl-tRNA formyltransferase